MLEVTTVSEEGYTCRTQLDGLELVIDAAGEDGPTSNEVLLADYASCFIPALRVAGRQRGIEDLGRVEVDVEGDLTEDDDLEAIRFHIRTGASVDEGTMAAVLERAEDICHIQAVLREDVQAAITYDADEP